MDELFESCFPLARFGQSYRQPEEYLADLMRLMELTLTEYLRRRGGAREPLDRFRGVIITERQVLETMEGDDGLAAFQDTARRQRAKAALWMASRKERSGLFFAPDYLFDRLGLDELERFTLLLCLMPQYDETYAKIFAFLQDDAERTRPGCALALALFDFLPRASLGEGAQTRLQALRDRCALLFLHGREGEVDPCIAAFFLQNGRLGLLPEGTRLRLPEEAEEPPALGGAADRVAEQIAHYRGEELLAFHLHAPAGAGGRTLAGLAAARRGMAVLYAQVPREDSAAWTLSVCRQAQLQQAWPCFSVDAEEDGSCRDMEPLLTQARRFCAVVFIRTTPPLCCRVEAPGVFRLECAPPTPDRNERLALWRHYMRGLPLAAPEQVEELADRFRFLPGQIAGAARAAEAEVLCRGAAQDLDRQTVNRCAYAQASNTLERRATHLPRGCGWDQLILEPAEKRMLENACDQVRLRHIVYGDWGFDQRVTYGRGVSMLFAGPPGTGKTMAAQVAARELDLEIYKVDLSQVVSKYIGETEKNLNDLFAEAGQSGAVLLFDETDALLGKRTEVKDSHDKNANMETSYLLQKMEEYEGVTILTTNYLENIDPAFFRRISYVIHFPFPDAAARERLWRGMFPAAAPLAGDIDFGYLARQFEIAGGNIKNAAVAAAFLAARRGGAVRMEHLVTALKYELAKQGKVLLAEDFGEYSFMLRREG